MIEGHSERVPALPTDITGAGLVRKVQQGPVTSEGRFIGLIPTALMLLPAPGAAGQRRRLPAEHPMDRLR